MSNKINFSHNIYEVLSEETHKYSGTSLSGGDITPIQTTTTHYSEQGLWLRDVATGKERKFEFSTFNIAARPGHKLICVWQQKSGELEAVKNLSTGATMRGINEFSTDNLCTWPGVVVMSLVLAAIFLIPFVGVLACTVSFLFGLTPVGHIKTKSLPSSKYRWGLLVGAFFYVWLGFKIIEHVANLPFFPFIFHVFIANVFLVFMAYTIPNNHVKNGREQLQQYLVDIEKAG